MKRLFLLFVITKFVSSYNIEENFPNLLQPKEQTNVKTSNFFGFEIRFGFGSDDALNVVIGSPQANPTATNHSKMHICSPETFGSVPKTCTEIPSPPEIEQATSLALTVEDNLDILACYPAKFLECSTTRLLPGFCYETSNRGRSWTRIFPDEELVCPTTSNLDLVFLLDGSNSVGSLDFDIVRQWVQEVSRQFNIEDGSTAIGVIQYSTFQPGSSLLEQPDIRSEIPLGEVTNRQEFESQVQAISYLGGRTFTSVALNRSVAEFRSSPRFMSPNTTKVLVLLTDGRASDSFSLAATAKYVRSLGIKVIAVGVGKAEFAELRLIATGTQTNQSVYFVDNFRALDEIAGQLQQLILNFALEGASTNPGSNSPLSELELAQQGISSMLSRRSQQNSIFQKASLPQIKKHQLAWYINNRTISKMYIGKKQE